MELRPNYRLTEVGVIPADWEIKTVGNLSQMVTVGFVGSMAHLFTTNGIPLLRGQNVLPRKIDLTGSKFISVQTHNLWKKSALRAGDITIVRVGYPGTCAVIPKNFGEANAASLVIVRPISSLVESDFMCWVLLSDIGRKQINAALVGGAQQVINIGMATSLVLPLPERSEQCIISAALNDVDALLNSLDRLIAKKRDLKQAAMQKLLTGQTRLPGFQGKWEQVRLGELFSFKNGLNKGKQFFGFGTPIVNYMDVFKNASLLCSQLQGRVSLTKQEIENFDVRKGDVLFTRTSETPEEIGLTGAILDEPIQTVFSGFVLRGRPKSDRLDDSFKAYCFRSSFVRNQIISKATYTTRALTNGRVLSAVMLLVPGKAEQIAVAKMLSDIDAELAALEQCREKTRALKHGMMQELLTGKTRLH